MAVLAVLAIFGYIAWQGRESGAVPPTPFTATTTSQSATTSATIATSSVRSVSVKGSGSYSIEMIPTANASASSLVAPNYKAPLSFSASIGTDQRVALNARFALDEAALTKNAYDFDVWIDLSTLRRYAGDYAGSRVILEYVSKQWPINMVSFNNLGDLNMNYIHDYPAAESNYLKQIANNPTDANAYRTLFTLYTELYKQDTRAAEDILRRGITANPQASDLKAMLDIYFAAQTSP